MRTSLGELTNMQRDRAPEFWGAVNDHLLLVGIALGAAILLCVPLGIWTARSRLASLAFMNTINGLRVIPSLAVLFLVVPYFGLSTGRRRWR
jgi:osmoprotectant transport system permease protein